MEDKLKTRVESNRQEWDRYETDLDGLWDNIAARLDQQKKKYSRWFWMKIAASVVMIIAVSWIVTIRNNTISQTGKLYRLSDISPDLAETEYYYMSQINETLQLISTSDADVSDFVMEDLALLDSAYRELQQDLNDNVDNEEVISAMIQNYRLKLQILEKVLYQVRTKQENDGEIII